MSVYADVLRYRELFASLFRRDLQARYKGSLLGVAWSLAHPLLLLAVYLLVFSLLWRVTGDIRDYPLYLVIGLAAWVFFASSLQAAARSLVDNANLVRRTRFPRQLVPLAAVATQLVTFAVMFVVVAALCAVAIPEARATIVLALPLAVLFVGFVAGMAVVVATANVVFRDVEHLVGALLLPWFFLTPVLYRIEQLPGIERHDALRFALRYGNPVTPPIEALRAPLWEGRAPRVADLAYLVVAALAALVLGGRVFRRLDDRVAVEL